MRKRTVIGKRVCLDEFAARTFLAESEILHLHQADHRIVVVGLQHVDIVGTDTRHSPELVDIQRPAATNLDRVIRK